MANTNVTAEDSKQRQKQDEISARVRERLISGLPVVERRLELNGVSTPVLEGGSGPPLVLLHGPGEYGASWLRVIPSLVATHRVIVPDLPGHGTAAAVEARAPQVHPAVPQAPAVHETSA